MRRADRRIVNRSSQTKKPRAALATGRGLLCTTGSWIYLRVIVRVALFVTPPYDAVMLALILLLTLVVAMLNVAELAPAGTVTFAGTLAFPGLLLAKVTTKALDVALSKVTVPTELDPPTTVVGFKVKDVSAAGVGAVTVSVVDLFTPAYVAVMLPTVVELTTEVFTAKFADDALAGTVTELGTDAAGLALAKVTMAPFAGAAPVRLTVPVADWPPVMLAGVTLTAFKAAGPAVGGL
jgi:hypothetical protein